MGSIQYPRIYFTGGHFWNPNTVNNNDYGGDGGINTWDPLHARFDWKYLREQGVDEFDGVPAFLRKPIDYTPHPPAKLPPAEWGLYGGQQCGFVTGDAPAEVGPGFSVPAEKTATTGWTGTDGRYSADAAEEPWLQQPIQLDEGSAKLVDINSASFWSSQIFTQRFTLGSADNGFTGTPVARMHSRLISLSNPKSGTASRNYNAGKDLVIAAEYGAVFQTCLKDISCEGGGRLRQQLEAAIDDRGASGLMLRYSAYCTLYFQGSVFAEMDPGDRYPLLEKMGELYEAYAQQGGDAPVSRAYSRVSGWIGLWMPGELASVPGGRFLIPWDPDATGGPAQIKVTPSDLEEDQYTDLPQNEPPNSDARVRAPQSLGPATVEVEVDSGSGTAERFTLDLANTFPERDSTCAKAHLGTAKLGLRARDGTIRWLSEQVPYDQATYERYGGLVDLPGDGITVAELAAGSLVLEVESGRAGATARVNALIETLATAQTDTRGMYAEQPDPSFSDGDAATPGPGMPSTRPGCEVQVRYQGWAPQDHPAEPRPALKLDYELWSSQIKPYPKGKTPIDVFYKDASGGFVPFSGPIDVPGDGCVEIQVVSKGSGIPNLVFKPYGDREGKYVGAPFAPPTGIGSSYYTVVKCLNWDNPLAESFEQWLATKPTLDQVNQQAWDLLFRSYFYGFPVMGFIDGPSRFFEMRQSIRAVTDPKAFDTPDYMPVTRTWSAGQRHIMNSYVAYVDSLLNAGAGAGAAAPAFRAPQTEGLMELRGVSDPNLGHG